MTTTTAPPATTAIAELARTHQLPAPRHVSRTTTGAALVLDFGGAPLDDLLAWAGEMAREPHWWTLPGLTGAGRRLVELFAAGTLGGLPVTLRTTTTEPLPDQPQTSDVIVAAAREPRTAL